jgi:hypothetical protein
MGTTSTVRNPQLYSLATEQQTTSSFGRLLHKSNPTSCLSIINLPAA